MYEKYPVTTNGYDADWWLENMPKGTPPPDQQYGYRRTMILVDVIERPIEVVGSNDEFMIRFWSGEDMICCGNYDEFCVTLHDMEEEMMIEQEVMRQQIEDMDEVEPPPPQSEN